MKLNPKLFKFRPATGASAGLIIASHPKSAQQGIGLNEESAKAHLIGKHDNYQPATEPTHPPYPADFHPSN